MKTLERVLEEELQAYEAAKARLLAESPGKFVAFKHQEFLGAFATFDEAYRAGLAKWGVVPMLIKKIAAADMPVSIPSVFDSAQ